MYYTVYKTYNLINGKEYIGKHQTQNINDKYMGSGKLLKFSINKYGKENFIKDVLYVFNNELEMNNKEKESVTEEYISMNMSYNMHEGGYGGFAHIRKSPKYLEWCSKGARNTSGRNHKNWGSTKFIKGEKRAKECSELGNAYRIQFGLSEEHKIKISNAAKLREEERRDTGYYQKKCRSDN